MSDPRAESWKIIIASGAISEAFYSNNPDPEARS